MHVLNHGRNTLYPFEDEIDLQPIMLQVYIWMGLAALLSAAVADITINTALARLAAKPASVLAVVLAEFGMMLGLSFSFRRLSLSTATILFFAYAALSGFTLSLVLLVFSKAMVVSAFAATAVLFGTMSIICYTTRVDVARMDTYLMMGVIGLVIAVVVSLFMSGSALDMLISMLGVLIFTALTAYDTQRISRMAAELSTREKDRVKLGIFGALRLWLDIINMFLFVLHLIASGLRN